LLQDGSAWTVIPDRRPLARSVVHPEPLPASEARPPAKPFERPAETRLPPVAGSNLESLRTALPKWLFAFPAARGAGDYPAGLHQASPSLFRQRVSAHEKSPARNAAR